MKRKISRNEFVCLIEAEENMDNYDYSEITDMSRLFRGNKLIKKIPDLDLTNLKSAYQMFDGCDNLEEVGILKTPNVEDTQQMFSRCVKLKKIKAIDTQSVKNFTEMFYGCESMKVFPELNLKSAETLAAMFSACRAMEKAPRLSTENVWNFSSLFGGCSNLKRVDYKIDLSSATVLDGMFEYCRKLEYIGGFVGNSKEKIVGFDNMFGACPDLNIDLKNLNMSKNACIFQVFDTGAKYMDAFNKNKIIEIIKEDIEDEFTKKAIQNITNEALVQIIEEKYINGNIQETRERKIQRLWAK